MSSKRKAEPSATRETRLSRGRTRPEAIFPVPPAASTLPASYAATLREIKAHLRSARIRAVLAANPIVIDAYWQTGKIILARQQEAGWGAKVIDRLASDLQAEFPDMSGLTRRNLFSMRAFADAFPDIQMVKQTVSQLPWGQIIRLIQMVKDPATREFYIRETLAHGWSRSMQEIQIKNQLHLRAGKAQNNFSLSMPPADSDMATQLFKDPYLFDVLGTADLRREAEVEQALVDHIQKFLLELGAGFAYVGRQVQLEVGGEDFPLDLLRHPDDQPTIGLLLCRKRNKLVAEYALRGLDQSIAVAEWQTRLTDTLPDDLRGSLPTIEEIEAELSGDFTNETEVES